MRALVVYESMFGNTRQVAYAIAEGLGTRFEVEVARADQAPTNLTDGWHLVVVGGPTHAFGLSRPATRMSAHNEHGAPADVAARSGIREWLDAASVPEGLPVAVFDTKVAKPKLPGAAGRAAHKQLRARHFHVELPPETFFVDGMDGPLLEGQLERARRWGGMLAATVTPLAV